MTFPSYNKKAQGNVFVYLMIGIVFFVLGLALTPALTDVATEATSTSQLNCTNTSSLTDQNKAVCTSIDIQPFLFMGTIFGLAGLLLTGAVLR